LVLRRPFLRRVDEVFVRAIRAEADGREAISEQAAIHTDHRRNSVDQPIAP
jgi:hypothetical protein